MDGDEEFKYKQGNHRQRRWERPNDGQLNRNTNSNLIQLTPCRDNYDPDSGTNNRQGPQDSRYYKNSGGNNNSGDRSAPIFGQSRNDQFAGRGGGNIALRNVPVTPRKPKEKCSQTPTAGATGNKAWNGLSTPTALTSQVSFFASKKGSRDLSVQLAATNIIQAWTPSTPPSYSAVLSGKEKPIRILIKAEIKTETVGRSTGDISDIETEKPGNSKSDGHSEAVVSSKKPKTNRNKPSKTLALADFVFVTPAKPKNKGKVQQQQTNNESTSKEKEKVKSKPSGAQAGNLLDSSVPVFHKGKTRENPKKKFSTTRKIILKEREVKKQKVSEGEEEENTETPPTTPIQLPQQPHSKKFRSYCENMVSEDLNQSVIELLQELCRFQDRVYQKDPMKARLKRRFVCGLREVKKLLSVDKIKCVIMAPNIEQISAEGGLDDQLQIIVESCREHSLPYLFALSKRKLASTLHKPRTVSCVGIINYQGAEEFFKRMMTILDLEKKRYAGTEPEKEDDKMTDDSGNHTLLDHSSQSIFEAAVNCKPFVPSPHRTVMYEPSVPPPWIKQELYVRPEYFHPVSSAGIKTEVAVKCESTPAGVSPSSEMKNEQTDTAIPPPIPNHNFAINPLGLMGTIPPPPLKSEGMPYLGDTPFPPTEPLPNMNTEHVYVRPFYY